MSTCGRTTELIGTAADCTGLAARWCPNHGDCTCDPIAADLGDRSHGDFGCPLHDMGTDHAGEPFVCA